METLQVTKENAIAAYQQADEKGKTLISNLLGKQHFTPSIEEWEKYIIPRVNTFADACRELGIDPNDPKFSWGDPDDQAYQKKKVVIRALNGPFIIKNGDPNQKKWQPWMEWTPSGFRLGDSSYVVTGADTTGGSRLRLCSEKISQHYGKAFEGLINQFLN